MKTANLGRNFEEMVAFANTAERQFLAAFFMEPDKGKLVEASQAVSLRNFESHQKYYEALVRHKIHGEDFGKVGKEYDIIISDVLSAAPLFSIEDATKRVRKAHRDLKLYRSIVDIAEKVGTADTDTLLSDLTKEAAHLASDGEMEETEIAKLMEQYEAEQEVNRKNGDKLLGWPTGLPKIDEAINGVRAPHLWIIGGYTSVGKTFFSLNVLMSLLKAGAKVVFYSLEMSKIDLISRMLGIQSGEEGTSILKGKTSKVIETAKLLLKSSPLKVFNGKRSLKEITLSITEQKIVWGADVVIIDYFQQIGVDGASTEYESMREVAMQFQTLAERMDVPIIGLSQISNDAARTPNSNVMGFKGAGTIASAADFALELLPDEKDVEEFRAKSMRGEPVYVKAIIKKNRHGKTGSVLLSFAGKTGKFTERHEDLDRFVEEAKQTKLDNIDPDDIDF